MVRGRRGRESTTGWLVKDGEWNLHEGQDSEGAGEAVACFRSSPRLRPNLRMSMLQG